MLGKGFPYYAAGTKKEEGLSKGRGEGFVGSVHGSGRKNEDLIMRSTSEEDIGAHTDGPLAGVVAAGRRPKRLAGAKTTSDPAAILRFLSDDLFAIFVATDRWGINE